VPKHLRDHALFIAFAPLDDPKIAVAVIAEHAGFGGTSAAPIARQMIDQYLLGKVLFRAPQPTEVVATPEDQVPADGDDDDSRPAIPTRRRRS
jgi:penicillin-binding protein 2